MVLLKEGSRSLTNFEKRFSTFHFGSWFSPVIIRRLASCAKCALFAVVFFLVVPAQPSSSHSAKLSRTGTQRLNISSAPNRSWTNAVRISPAIAISQIRRFSHSVSEPSLLAMLGTGLLGMSTIGLRRRAGTRRYGSEP